MPFIENLSVGILIDHEDTIFRTNEMILKQCLEKMATSLKYVKDLSLSRRKIENLHHIKFYIEEWSLHEKVDLIFIIGDLGYNEHSITNKGLSVVNFKQLPSLQKLLIQDNKDFANAEFKCSLSAHSLIVLLKSLELLEACMRETFPLIMSALTELKLNYPLVKIEAVKEKFYLKSKVVLVKVAERPRQSLFQMISVCDALKYILKESKTLKSISKNVEDSLGYILAENVTANEPYPPFKASIKDGYAVLADDPSDLKDVIGSVSPGCELDFDLKPGTCVRVSTGSALPIKADAVIQVEDTVVAEKDSEGNELKIKIMKKVKQHQDIRSVGSDVSVGEILIHSKRKITSAEIGVLAVCGIQNVMVYYKPCVALLSTGDEVLEPFTPLKPGCIRDSNKSSLKSLLLENQISFVDVGIAKDTADDIKTRLALAMETADIIISTGSVSMGEKDLLKLVLEQDFDAKIHFGRVHMKPGKPTTFSTVEYNKDKKLIFSLPGNPVSAYVCFFLFVLPCIKKLMGYEVPEHKIVKVKVTHEIKLDERPEFYRVSLKPGVDSTFLASSTGSQQSSRLLSMQNADALLVLPPKTSEQTELKAGAIVDAILLESI